MASTARQSPTTGTGTPFALQPVANKALTALLLAALPALWTALGRCVLRYPTR